MLHTLLVGLGRSGRELHLPVLRRLRQSDGAAGAGALFAPDFPLGYDVAPLPGGESVPGLLTVPSPGAARARLDPRTTVVHVCTPPTVRAEVITEFAELGFRRFLVEKPIGTGSATVDALRLLRDRYGLRLAVVAPWLHSTLTERLQRIVTSRSLGGLRGITVHQRKPRLRRSLATPSHPTAFDVELPHSVGVALRLAGAARVHQAAWTDARTDTTVVPRMGTAGLTLRHHGGVVSRLVTDLASPLRERSIVLDFDAGTAVGHYPISGEDPYAHLRVTPIGLPERHDVFPDEALDTCLHQVYRGFADGRDFTADFELQAAVVDVLERAKRQAAAGDDGAGGPAAVAATAGEGPRRVA